MARPTKTETAPVRAPRKKTEPITAEKLAEALLAHAEKLSPGCGVQVFVRAADGWHFSFRGI